MPTQRSTVPPSVLSVDLGFEQKLGGSPKHWPYGHAVGCPSSTVGHSQAQLESMPRFFKSTNFTVLCMLSSNAKCFAKHSTRVFFLALIQEKISKEMVEKIQLSRLINRFSL